LDPPRLRKVTIMSEQLNNMNNHPQRYQQINVVEHLASQYVLGTLTSRVQKRVAALRPTHDQRIHFWQEKLVHLDEQTPELPTREATWDNILSAIEETPAPQHVTASTTENVTKASTEKHSNQTGKKAKGFIPSLLAWFTTPSTGRFASAFSIAAVFTLALYFMAPVSQKADALSYVAVLTQTDGDAHIVASTYGESKKLIINVVDSPELTPDQTHELWVISKTDNEARSLGVIPKNKTLITQQLTQAQWRLIKDSDSLIITVEEAGGSPIGEPGEMVVSRGLCVRLQEWNSNA